MRKVVLPEEMQFLERAAGVTPEELMERAAIQLAFWIDHLQHEKHLEKQVTLLAGSGNNAGDGYAALRELKRRGFQVAAYKVLKGTQSPLCQKKENEYKEAGGSFVTELPEDGIILDGIFGSGFHGTLAPPLQKLIQEVNHRQDLFVVSIDIPSGLNGATGESQGAIFADVTLAIELPKLGFFLLDGWNHVGQLHCLSIGLDAEHLVTDCQWLEIMDMELPPIIRNRNKYKAGHVVGIAGSSGMAGAAMLASHAALRAGAGIVHLLHPQSLASEFVGPPWEIVRLPIQDLKTTKEWLKKASSCFVGPGLGQSKEATKLLESIFKECKDKAIFDADCLNWLATQKGPIGPLPNAILTPHLGEMMRLLKTKVKEPISMKFLDRCRAFAEKNKTHVVLKGAPSFLFSPGEPITIMSRGDPGMATAGAGDVLTGILAGLRAQGLAPKEAMWLGTYLHGLAGEFAAKHDTSYCITASSLTNYLPAAIHLFESITLR